MITSYIFLLVGHFISWLYWSNWCPDQDYTSHESPDKSTSRLVKHSSNHCRSHWLKFCKDSVTWCLNTIEGTVWGNMANSCPNIYTCCCMYFGSVAASINQLMKNPAVSLTKQLWALSMWYKSTSMWSNCRGPRDYTTVQPVTKLLTHPIKNTAAGKKSVGCNTQSLLLLLSELSVQA